jgi:hypothetical protein
LLWKEVAGLGKKSLDSYIFGQDHPKKRAFLTAYATLGNITSAAKAAKIGRQTHYDWCDADPEYVQAFHHAKEAFGDMLEAEALRRATKGVEHTIYQGGRAVGKKKEYSDTLLIFLMKGERPDKYKERTSTELTGAGGKPITVSFISPSEGEDGGA